MPSASALVFHPVGHLTLCCRLLRCFTSPYDDDAEVMRRFLADLSQVEMVVAAGGFDTSGTVKMFKCPTPETVIGLDQPNGH